MLLRKSDEVEVSVVQERERRCLSEVWLGGFRPRDELLAIIAEA